MASSRSTVYIALAHAVELLNLCYNNYYFIYFCRNVFVTCQCSQPVKSKVSMLSVSVVMIMCMTTQAMTQNTSIFICRYGSGTGRIWLDDVDCTGFESRLTSCTNRGIGSHNCRHSEDVAIYCAAGTSTCMSAYINLSLMMTPTTRGCLYKYLFVGIACESSLVRMKGSVPQLANSPKGQ